MSMHTTGPWIADNFTVKSKEGAGVACTLRADVSSDDEAKANAVLIAAAPWMLAVIKQLAHAIEHGDGYAVDAAHSSAQLLIEHMED